VLEGSGVLHGQVYISYGQLMGQVIYVFHSFLDLGQLFFKQLKERENEMDDQHINILFLTETFHLISECIMHCVTTDVPFKCYNYASFPLQMI